MRSARRDDGAPSRVCLGAIAFIESERSCELDVAAEVVAAGGEVVQAVGLLVVAWFDSVTSCTRCLATLQSGKCRAGLSVGDVLVENGLLHGLPVVEAGRLKDLAKPDQVLCTARFASLGEVPAERSSSLGEVQLKGIDRKVTVLELR